MTSEGKGTYLYQPSSSAQRTNAATTFREPNRMKLTIKMLTDAIEEPRDQGRLVVNHSQVYTVQVCGLLMSVDQSEPYTDFVVYDGTGSVRGRIWSTAEDGKTDLSGSTLHQYYIINGTVSVIDKELRLDALNAREVTDHKQVTEHLLSVILEHLELEERFKSKTQIVPSATRVSTELDKESVIWFLSDNQIRSSESGASETELMEYLNIEVNSFRKVMDCLINEGIVYNTIDEVHYKLADNSG